MFLNSVKKTYSQHILKQLQAILIACNNNGFAVIVRRLQRFASIRIELWRNADNKQTLNENKLIEQVLANIRTRETPAIPYTHIHVRRTRRDVVSFGTRL